MKIFLSRLLFAHINIDDIYIAQKGLKWKKLGRRENKQTVKAYVYLQIYVYMYNTRERGEKVAIGFVAAAAAAEIGSIFLAIYFIRLLLLQCDKLHWKLAAVIKRSLQELLEENRTRFAIV